jgi:AmmeMemoRadiSam system protein A
MRDAANTLTSLRPDGVVLISPHSPRRRRTFGLWAGERVEGSFAQFNASHARVSLPNNPPLAAAVVDQAAQRRLATWMIEGQTLDHGALVPLWFLVEAGWAGPAIVLSLNYPGEGGLVELGEALAAAALTCRQRIALVASGDMSHCLTPGAPCGFQPRAHEFDELFIRLIGKGDYHEIERIDPELRQLAAEDAVDSTLIATASVAWRSVGHKVLSYEGPFGVGYGVAVLYADEPNPVGSCPVSVPAEHNEGVDLTALARRSVTAALRGLSEPPPTATGPYLSAKRGVFVTLREASGALRGCAGTIVPSCADVAAETCRSARLAAFEDPRFPSVRADELPGLKIEVSVLHSMEEIPSLEDLDPARYGVVVSSKDGRRGLLLPAIAEIKSPEQQVSIARRKARIGPDEPISLKRFQVDHFEEQPQGGRNTA